MIPFLFSFFVDPKRKRPKEMRLPEMEKASEYQKFCYSLVLGLAFSSTLYISQTLSSPDGAPLLLEKCLLYISKPSTFNVCYALPAQLVILNMLFHFYKIFDNF